MSTARALNTVPANRKPLIKAVSAIVPIKFGIYGAQGSGKTTTAALIALWLSVTHHGGAPVFVTDTEPGWQFLRRIFKIEGVELIQRTVPTFAAMLNDMREAEREGACVHITDQLTIIWQDLMQSFKTRNRGRIPINVWGDIKQLWNGEYSTLFRNSPLHCGALGRMGNVMDEIEEENAKGELTGDTKLVKTGTQFKAGGGESFGYEPDLLLELSTERKAKVRGGSRHEGEGRIIHRADVLKDRSWALNGKVLRFSDKPSYEKGGYITVGAAIKPHFDFVQETGQATRIETGVETTSLITENGHSDYYDRKQRRDILAAEISAALDLLWAGTGKQEKTMRTKVIERVFGFCTKEALEQSDLRVVERGLHILQTFRKRCAGEPDILLQDDAAVLITLDIDIEAYDKGAAEFANQAF